MKYIKLAFFILFFTFSLNVSTNAKTNINLTTLPNGFRVATDEVPDVETVSIMLAVNIGSRNESKEQSGISHFLEHMAFKGTKKRTSLQIFEQIERVGGNVNAYTSKDKTVYQVILLKENLELGVDILSDIIQNSTFEKKEIEKEREVILQELASYEDNPSQKAFEIYTELAYPNQPLGRPIIGTAENIKRFTAKDFKDYINEKYHAGNMVLSIAGNIKHEKAEELAKKYFSKMKKKNVVTPEPSNYLGGELKVEKKDLNQVQYILGYKGFSISEKNQYTLSVLSYILGGGASSNLYKEIRQKRGLVYSVASFQNSFSDGGIFTIYAATSKEKIEELNKVIEFELKKMETKLVSKSDVEKTINQLKASLFLSLESTIGRSQKLAYDILDKGRYIPHEEIIKDFEAITPEKIREVAREVLSSNKTLIIYGNI